MKGIFFSSFLHLDLNDDVYVYVYIYIYICICIYVCVVLLDAPDTVLIERAVGKRVDVMTGGCSVCYHHPVFHSSRH